MTEQGGQPAEGEILQRGASLPEARSGKPPALKVDLGRSISNTTKVTVNVAQQVHVTTRDKIELALRKSLPLYVDASSVLAPLGVFLALFVGLVTADFRTLFGIEKDVWEAIFILASGASAIWTLRQGWKFLKRKSLNDLVEAIVAESDDG